MDWDIAVFILWMVGAIIAFTWRRTRNKIFFYAWLALMWLEIEFRKIRDRKLPKDKRNI